MQMFYYLIQFVTLNLIVILLTDNLTPLHLSTISYDILLLVLRDYIS